MPEPSPVLSRRTSGVLIHISSLPLGAPIGDLGDGAYRFVDLLAAARQSWWQLLPINPPAIGNSPYSSYSAFAGNPLFISLPVLMRDGLLPREPSRRWLSRRVDYASAAKTKLPLLQAAGERFFTRRALHSDFERFCHEERSWLDDYTIFMAIREATGRPWIQWPHDLAFRDPQALLRVSRDLRAAIAHHKFLQFMFARQFARLREYAHQHNIRLLGDMPMFVSYDSCDVWTNRHLFELDRAGRPIAVAGVPPDLFSRSGQLWGNPLYNWKAMARERFAWWISRVRQSLRDVDLVRLDHFRGLESLWRVPAKAKSARSGKWVRSPGRELLLRMQGAFRGLPLVAEDLGVITPQVERLRDEFSLPGMKVLQFAYDGSPANPHLPHNHVANSIVYTGTHDNDTTVGWWHSLSRKARANVTRYCPGVAADPAWALIESAMGSVARLAIIPAQDILRQGTGSRMNTPGKAEGNWEYRLLPNDWKTKHTKHLRELTEKYGRAM